MNGETQPPVLIEASGICKRIGGRDVLADAGLTVHRGELVTLIGPNGAGKSTLIKIMMGVMTADAGTVTRAPGLTIGYLPQFIHIEPALPLTVDRFLALGGAGRARVAEVLGEVGATDTRASPVQELSGGEFQRVLLARALLRQPDLLVLDEPLRGVDLGSQADLYDLLAGIRQSYGAGMLMISHDLHLVMAATDQVVCLNHHVCCAGKPEAVRRDPAYVELVGPRVAERVAFYTHEHDHEHDARGNVVTADPDGGERTGGGDG